MTDNDLESQFDRWAPSYDADVRDEQRFPFAGYQRVLERVVALAGIVPGMALLELGAGTGNLTQRLVAAGAAVWALDFSAEMLARARQKAPQATYGQAHLLAPYPPEFERRFDAVVSTYTFHELPLDDKIQLLARLFCDHLKEGGAVVVGDIGFPDAAGRDKVRRAAGEAWDEEYYWLEDETKTTLAALGLTCSWEQVSFSGVVLYIREIA